MNLTRVWAIALRIYYLYRGSPARLAPLETQADAALAWLRRRTVPRAA